jgi:hypothetical protein
MLTAPSQDRAVNGAPRFLTRQVSDAFDKHYALMLADTPSPERSDTAQRPPGRLSSPLRAAPAQITAQLFKHSTLAEMRISC